MCQETDFRTKHRNPKLHLVITGRQQKAPVKVSAVSAVPPVYIALCIGIANKETIGAICHSFIAVWGVCVCVCVHRHLDVTQSFTYLHARQIDYVVYEQHAHFIFCF